MSGSQDYLPSYLRVLILGLLIPGIVFSALVLMAFAYAASQWRARPHLYRVSFRLLVYALVSNFILSVTLIPVETLMTGPISPAGCTFAAFAGNASLLFSACMYFCMALNLQLVVIQGVNGLMMEKYYVIGSSLLVGVCNITPLAGGQFGLYDDLCWFSNPDPVVRFRWIFGTQTFWIVFMASLELVCFVILMSYMHRHRLLVKRIRLEISAKMTPLQQAPILQYRAIILRITLYPLLSCVLGFSVTAVDMYLAKHLENTELKVQLTVVDQCIFNARPLLYAVLAATDPSFLRAIGALRNQYPSAGSDGSQQTSNIVKSQSLNSRSTTSSSDTQTQTDGDNAEGDSMVRQSLDAAARPQTQPEAVVNHTCTHRDPEEGIEWHFNVVESRSDSIEFQI